MTDTRTDEQIEQEVIEMAVHIWDTRDVFASKCLMHTYCTCPDHGEPRWKTWCLPQIATMDSLCAGCWVHTRIKEMKAMRDKYNREHGEDLDMQMPKEQQREYCNKVMRSNNPPKEWRQPKLDLADFASIK